MKKFQFFITAVVAAAIGSGANAAEEARVGVVSPAASRPSIAALQNVRSPNMTANLPKPGVGSGNIVPQKPAEPAKPDEPEKVASNCRDAYRECMNEFCLLDESEGKRCACSDNISQSKSLIKEIMEIQEKADKAAGEVVEYEKYGAKALLVFGQSDRAKKTFRSSMSLTDWLNSSDSEDNLDDDFQIGSYLYSMAADSCKSKLDACAQDKDREELLYERMIAADCKEFSGFLSDQKKQAQQNLLAAEKAVRTARASMLDTTNKYNRGECLIALRACVSDKGGCGVNFENCLDESMLSRRTNACDNILDQCMATRDYVKQDWKAESRMILDDAAKYADANRRNTCRAKIRACLEDNCSVSTSVHSADNSMCLNNINIAAGICPIIDECNAPGVVPGIKQAFANELASIRVSFCQNDVGKCLQDKCGVDFTAPECFGKSVKTITDMCPKKFFVSCGSYNDADFKIIMNGAMWGMEDKMMTGCLNTFAAKLGQTCGLDMTCLPPNPEVAALQKLPSDEAGFRALRDKVEDSADAEVGEFFKQFNNLADVPECANARQPAGKKKMGAVIFETSGFIAKIQARARAVRELDAKIAEFSRKQDLAEAKKNCETLYKPETPDKRNKNYSYVKSVHFEPALRNCHICRMQQVCEEGGENEWTSALKAGAGGSAAGASAGTMVSPGWGTAIGGAVGLVGGGLMGYMSGGEKEFCQEIESCEDVNF